MKHSQATERSEVETARIIRRRNIGAGVFAIAMVAVGFLTVKFENSREAELPAPSIDQPSTTQQRSLDEEGKELLATILNLNGLLCSEVVSVNPLVLEEQFEVTCVEYRGGQAEVTYIYNKETGKAFRQ